MGGRTHVRPLFDRTYDIFDHMKNIECEVRSLVSKEEYDALIGRFTKEAKDLGEDEQVTYYFDSTEDLRIQKNSQYAKVWLKKGALHEDHREEIEIKVPKEDFEKLEQLFLALGYNISIKWFRRRHAFTWGDIDVAVDYTKGYGYIVEFEKLSDADGAEETVGYLKTKFAELGIAITPKEEFDEKYQHYKEHWRELV